MGCAIARMSSGKSTLEVPEIYRNDGKRDSLRPDSQLRVVRPILNQPAFDAMYGLLDPGPPLRPWDNIKRIGKKLWKRNATTNKTKPQRAYSFIAGWFPVISWLPRYDFRRLAIADLIAGITVGVMNVPQGVAYAILAGLPPVCGLYTSFVPILLYFAMGTSRQCSMGTFAIISMMTQKIIRTYGPSVSVATTTAVSVSLSSSELITNATSNFTSSTASAIAEAPPEFTEFELRTMAVAAAAGFSVGLWQILLGVLGFGAFTVYLSDQLVQGFTCASAFHVFSSQLKSVFGVKGLEEHHGVFKIIKTYIQFFEVIHTAHWPTMVIALVSIIILVAIKYGINKNKKIRAVIKVPVPAELVIVIIGSSISYSFDFQKNCHISTVENIPLGMPPPTLPAFEVIPSMLGDSFALAVVAFAITVTLGMLFASKHNYSISPNQEFKALGIGNLVGSFFRCFPSGASLARSAVQDSVGGRTQVVSLIQSCIVLSVILALGNLMEPLPRACLGAIVMVAVIHLLEQAVELVHLWKVSFVDWTIFLVVFLSVLILDVDIGVAIGVAYAIMTVMFRMQKPKIRGLGRLPGTDLYKPLDVYTTAYQRPEVRIVRVDAPIYFANAAYIKTRLYNLAGLNEAMRELKHAKEDTPEDEKKNYAFTNTIAMEDTEDQPTEQYARKGSSASVGRRPSKLPSSVSLEILKEKEVDSEQGSDSAPTLHVIIDCSEVSFVDVTGVAFLKKTAEECQNIGVVLLLAAVKKSVRDTLELCDAYEFIKPEQMFVTVHDAVLYALNAQAGHGLMLNESNRTSMNAKHQETPM